MSAHTSPSQRGPRRTKVLAGLATIGLVGAFSATTAFADHVTTQVDLAASQTGDPDGTGNVALTFDATSGEVCSVLTTADIDAPTAAHIHRGVAGSTGPVVVTLDVGEGCSDNDPALVAEILAAPADFYVNVHNTAFPSGAIRTQVGAPTDSAVSSTSFDLLPTGDPTGTGTAALTFDSESGEVCFDIQATTATDVTVAHIHEGAEGANGPVVVDFDVAANGLMGCVASTPEQVASILADSAGFYVNVHTTAAPMGAIRNQIAPASPLQSSTADLDGLGFGDPDGSGTATFTLYPNGDICFTITTADIDTPTAAHIHTGADGVQGPVLVGLPIDAGLTGCVTTTPENVAAIIADPSGFYVNVHNAEFPAGAIRAQLTALVDAPAITSFDIALAASGDADGSGTAQLAIDGATGRVCFELTTSGTDDVTVAHIHSGALGMNGDVVIDFDIPTNGLMGCVFVAPAVAAAVIADPAAFYVNVHTAEFPAGAIRAQVNGDTMAPVLELPETGGETTVLVIIATLLLAAGAGLILSSRPRWHSVN